MKHIMIASILAGALLSSSVAYSQGRPAETYPTGSVVSSTMTLVSLTSVFDGKVQGVKSNEANTKDIEIQQKDSKTIVVRVPEQQANEVQAGQKADFVANPNGHTLKIENKPVVQVLLK